MAPSNIRADYSPLPSSTTSNPIVCYSTAKFIIATTIPIRPVQISRAVDIPDIAALEAAVTSLEDTTAGLEVTTAELEATTASLEATTAGLETTTAALEDTSADLVARTANITAIDVTSTVFGGIVVISSGGLDMNGNSISGVSNIGLVSASISTLQPRPDIGPTSIGSSTSKFNNLYVENAYCDDITTTGFASINTSLQAATNKVQNITNAGSLFTEVRGDLVSNPIEGGSLGSVDLPFQNLYLSGASTLSTLTAGATTIK